MVQATFGKAFKIEEGKVVAYDANGNKIFSQSRPGELAEFDEALEALVDAYPHKDHILKPTGAQGSGAPNGNGNPHPGAPKSLSECRTDAEKVAYLETIK